MNLNGRARTCLHQLRAGLWQASGCLWWAKRQLRRRGAVVVLTFHRVLDENEFQSTSSLPGIVIRRETFSRLAAFIAGNSEVIDSVAMNTPKPGTLRLMVTFDDGWKDTYTNALPVIRTYSIPAIVFVCPGLIGRPLPFWPELVSLLLKNSNPPASGSEIEALVENLKTYTPEHRQQYLARLCETYAHANCQESYRTDRTVTWDDIREMEAAGIRFGCHTQTHQILTTVTARAARQEVRTSKHAIEAALFRRCDLFAYPNGNFSPATRRMLASEGFAAAFTTRRGAWTAAGDPMAIPRINVCESNVVGLTGRFSAAVFQYNVFWKAWRALRDEERAEPAGQRRAAHRHARIPMISQTGNSNIQ